MGARNPALATPIFVVGMPRSGSTLLEQLLGSHSWVWAAGVRACGEVAAGMRAS